MNYYKGLIDQISIDDDLNLTDIEYKVTILPSSHRNSLKHIKRLMKNIKTIICKYDKRDLFITFIYNSK